jgi:hypothetical protein
MKNVKIKVVSDSGDVLKSKKLIRAIPSEMLTVQLDNVPTGCKSITVYFEI